MTDENIIIEHNRSEKNKIEHNGKIEPTRADQKGSDRMELHVVKKYQNKLDHIKHYQNRPEWNGIEQTKTSQKLGQN